MPLYHIVSKNTKRYLKLTGMSIIAESEKMLSSTAIKTHFSCSGTDILVSPNGTLELVKISIRFTILFTNNINIETKVDFLGSKRSGQ